MTMSQYIEYETAILKRRITALKHELTELEDQLALVQNVDLVADTIPMEELDLSVRTYNSLKLAGVHTIGDILSLWDMGPDALLALRRFGDKALEELVAALVNQGFLEDV